MSKTRSTNKQTKSKASAPSAKGGTYDFEEMNVSFNEEFTGSTSQTTQGKLGPSKDGWDDDDWEQCDTTIPEAESTGHCATATKEVEEDDEDDDDFYVSENLGSSTEPGSFATESGNTDVNDLPPPDVESIINGVTMDTSGFHNDVMRALSLTGYDTFTSCQKLVPHLYADTTNSNVAICAPTGSGKTIMSFLLAINFIINKFDTQDPNNTDGRDDRTLYKPQAMIIVHSRDLALQVYDACVDIATNLGITIAMHRGVGAGESRKKEGERTNSRENVCYCTNSILLEEEYGRNLKQINALKQAGKPIPPMLRTKHRAKFANQRFKPGNEQIIIGTIGKLCSLTNPTEFNEKINSMRQRSRNKNAVRGFPIQVNGEKTYGKIESSSVIRTDFTYFENPLDLSNVLSVIIDEADAIVKNESRDRHGTKDQFSLISLLQSTFTKVSLEDGTEAEQGPIKTFFVSASIDPSNRDFYNSVDRIEYPIPLCARYSFKDTTRNITPYHACVDSESKKLVVLNLIISKGAITYGMIFTKNNDEITQVKNFLEKQKLKVLTCPDGVYNQYERDAIFDEFRHSINGFLVVTHSMSRGIDFNSLENVIIFSLPRSDIDITHATGRCARHTRSGKCYVIFVTDNNDPTHTLIKKKIKIYSTHLLRQFTPF